MEAAEDITSETFLSALETWPYKGIPPNPTAWLHAVAKNKARNFLIRQKNFNTLATNIAETGHTAEIDLSEQNIFDSQLQMLFAICHPTLSPEAQIGLALPIRKSSTNASSAPEKNFARKKYSSHFHPTTFLQKDSTTYSLRFTFFLAKDTIRKHNSR